MNDFSFSPASGSGSPGASSEKVPRPASTGTGHASASFSSPQFPHLNPRSCVTCRRRKVKCDKREPCGNCRKAHIECIFPAPGRAPRRPRKPPDSELMARLRKLEGVVQSLGQNVDEDGKSQDSPSMSHSERPGSSDFGAPQRTGSSSAQERHNHAADWAVDHHRSSLDKSFGRLVMNEGRTRYVTNSFWASLNYEVEDLKSLLVDGSDEDEQPISPASGSPYSPQQQGSHQGFLFQFSSHAVDLSSLHPPANLIMEYWRIFEEHCDPLVKMIHRPTIRKQLESLKNSPSSAGRGMEATLFSVYFAAITSMSDEECLSVAGEQRPELVARYRFGVEQALARANLLVTEELITLQAMILFLLCLRRHEDARIIWSLSGVVVRVAITMGLHRDGTNFGLSPFDTEIRRRTWWQICVLDVRTSEDHGCDPTIISSTFDTRVPLNIPDSDLWPSMTEYPKERNGVTEMTFCLIRFEVAVTFRRLAYRSDQDEPDAVTLQDKERWIQDCHNKLEEKYLKHCDMNIPMHWVICTVSRLIMAKMWLIIYHEFQREDQSAILSENIKDRLFMTSMESIQYALLLETEVRTVKWGWLFRTYAQWHALAYLLSELCHRTTGPHVQRAWRTVDAAVGEWGSRVTNPQKAHLWKPLRKLLARARTARAQAMAMNATSADVAIDCNENRNAGLANGIVTGGAARADGNGSSNSEQFRANATNDMPKQMMAGNDGKKQDFSNPFLQVPPNINGLEALETNNFGNMNIPGSPFFVNQPPGTDDKWNFNSSESANNFLNTLYSESLDTPPTVSAGNDAMNLDEFVPKGDGDGSGDDQNSGSKSPAVNDPAQRQMGSRHLGLGATDPIFTQDPMLTAGAGNEQTPPPNGAVGDDPLQWDAWNDMIREFQGGSSTNAWQQRGGMMGDTWL